MADELTSEKCLPNGIRHGLFNAPVRRLFSTVSVAVRKENKRKTPAWPQAFIGSAGAHENFLSREARGLPLVSLSPLSLARMLPGVAVPAGSTVYTTLPGGAATIFSVNGQRLRGNGEQ
jgi:hypothetical protein